MGTFVYQISVLFGNFLAILQYPLRIDLINRFKNLSGSSPSIAPSNQTTFSQSQSRTAVALNGHQIFIYYG
jgi:hypothetical protein